MGRKELVRLGWAWSNFLSSKSHQSLQAELRRRKGEDKGDAPLRAGEAAVVVKSAMSGVHTGVYCTYYKRLRPEHLIYTLL